MVVLVARVDGFFQTHKLLFHSHAMRPRRIVNDIGVRQIPNEQLVLQEKLLHDRFFQRMSGRASA